MRWTLNILIYQTFHKIPVDWWLQDVLFWWKVPFGDCPHVRGRCPPSATVSTVVVADISFPVVITIPVPVRDYSLEIPLPVPFPDSVVGWNFLVSVSKNLRVT